jgi:type IV pilus assembly protein PilY1
MDFTLAAAGKSDWNMAKLSFFKQGTNPIPMYTAKDGSSNRQPISMEPALAFGANRSIIVSFGTGKFLEASDNVVTGAPQQSVYALYDNGDTTPDSGTSSVAAIAGRARLAAGTTSGNTITVPTFTWGRSLADVDATGVRSGWYFDFAHTGERQISGFGVLQGYLVYGSVIPSLNSCDNGNGYLYISDLQTGSTTSLMSTIGILGAPLITQVGSSSTTNSNTTGGRIETTRFQIILQGSGGNDSPCSLSKVVTGTVGRLSWREISNYQQLRNSP